MTNGNLKIWDTFADIDPAFTKAITGKPYKGTSPNPHYVIRCLTELFGPVGCGFGWDVEAEGFQPMGEELLHWCRIRFWHGDGRGFSAYGQTKAVMKTKSGFLNDEDAPKKSLTDAITKAAAQVGVGANIFLGRWDDSKYVAGVADEYREKNAPPPDHGATVTRLKAAISTQPDAATLDKLWSGTKFQAALSALPDDMKADVQKAFTDRQADLFIPGQDE